MVKNKAGLFISVLILLLFCVAIPAQAGARRLIVSVNKGKNYHHKYKFGLINMKFAPQMAFWIEDAKGNFVSNIYITHRSATSQWRGGWRIRRPEALPVWSHKQGIRYSDGLYMPDRKNPLPDAVTGATPDKFFEKEWIIPQALPTGQYIIKAEINNSFDYNEKYKKDLPESHPFFNAENGQPSVIYKGELIFGPNNTKISLSPYGFGHPLGKDGKVYQGLDGMTSALEIIRSIEVYYIIDK